MVIGQGNVAMDVSRILAKTVDELRETDITERALDALAGSRVREIHVIGRRGPVQAKFTPPEIKEIGQLADCDPVVDPRDLELAPACRAELEDPKNTHARKNLAVLEEFASRTPAGKRRRYHLRFFLSPVAVLGEDRMERLVLEKNRLSGEPFHQSARGTGETATLEAGLLFRSVGYRGVPVPGLPFEERKGVIPSRDGRVIEGETILPGLYVAGWIKRGPSGVIGTNKPDSYETVASLLADLPGLAPCPRTDSAAFGEWLRARGVRVVSFEDWKRLDALETERGRAAGKPREKFTRLEEMLERLLGA